jgi:hypothetical protein
MIRWRVGNVVKGFARNGDDVLGNCKVVHALDREWKLLLRPAEHNLSNLTWRLNRQTEAAVGYVELGMFQEANDQLENIDPFNRAAPEVLAVRIAVYRGLKKWELMREVAKRLAEFQPDEIRGSLSPPTPIISARELDAALLWALASASSLLWLWLLQLPWQ